MRGDADFLADILEAGERIIGYVGGRSLDAFEQDLMAYDAVLYRLAVIGEAARNLSKLLRDTRPDVPWRRIIGMRNILVHDYFGTDVEITHRTATVHVPELMTAVRAMVPPDAPAAGPETPTSP